MTVPDIKADMVTSSSNLNIVEVDYAMPTIATTATTVSSAKRVSTSCTSVCATDSWANRDG